MFSHHGKAVQDSLERGIRRKVERKVDRIDEGQCGAQRVPHRRHRCRAVFLQSRLNSRQNGCRGSIA